MIGTPPNATWGGFVGDSLAGTAGLVVSGKRKQRHKGHVVGVYAADPWRRAGLGRALLDRLIQEARADGLMLLTLSVTVGNAEAMRYTRCDASPRDCRRRVAVHEWRRRRDGYAPWTVMTKDDGRIVGWGSLYNDPFDTGWGIEVGYFLIRQRGASAMRPSACRTR